jgi:hypothetical protein
VDTAKVVVGDIKRDGGDVVFKFLAKRIRQSELMMGSTKFGRLAPKPATTRRRDPLPTASRMWYLRALFGSIPRGRAWGIV